MGFRSWLRGIVSKSPTGPGNTTVVRVGSAGTDGPRRGTREILRAFRETPWVHTVDGRLAHERASAMRWTLYDAPPDDDERKRIGRKDSRYELMRVMRRPVKVAGGARVITPRQRDLFCALTFGLVGEWFMAKQRGPQGLVTGLVPLSPLWVTGVPTRDKPYFSVCYDGASETVRINPDDMIWGVDLDAENPMARGVGAAATLSDEIDTDEGLARMDRATVANQGTPAGLLMFEGIKSPAQAEEIDAAFQRDFGGADRAGKVKTVAGKATFIPLPRPDLKDSVEARKYLRDMFFHTRGVSGEIFGVLDGSTRDSAYVAYYHLALGALVPWLETVRDVFQACLVPDFNGGDEDSLFLEYESPVPEDRDLKSRILSIAPAAFEGADARRLGGFAPNPVLDRKPLGAQPQLATPTQLPPGPSNGRRSHEAVFERSLAADPTEPFGSDA